MTTVEISARTLKAIFKPNPTQAAILDSILAITYDDGYVDGLRKAGKLLAEGGDKKGLE